MARCLETGPLGGGDIEQISIYSCDARPWRMDSGSVAEDDLPGCGGARLPPGVAEPYPEEDGERKEIVLGLHGVLPINQKGKLWRSLRVTVDEKLPLSLFNYMFKVDAASSSTRDTINVALPGIRRKSPCMATSDELFRGAAMDRGKLPKLK